RPYYGGYVSIFFFRLKHKSLMISIAEKHPTSVPVLGAQEALNNGCFCLTLDNGALARALDFELAGVQLSELVRERCP
ncbi:hypothetical protein, partial [Priestia megaterium]|uniref:hypothetical protein n=1 Tax=Priestia megaterium TaxID=1404 RepID=UPI0035B605B4